MDSNRTCLLLLLSIIGILIISVKIHADVSLVDDPAGYSSGPGVCGNTLYDTKEDNQNFGITRLSSMMTTEAEYAARRERLRKDFVVIRLKVVVDESLSIAFRHNMSTIERFVRDLIFSTQLYLEREEISTYVKINLVVYSVSQSTQKFNQNLDVYSILKYFSFGPDADTKLADVNLLLAYRNLWSINVNARVASERQVKVMGLANIGVFCNPRAGHRSLILQATSIGSAITLAHELAHTLNVHHDGTENASGCSSNYLMAPFLSYRHYTWSTCSRDMLLDYLLRTDIFHCLNDTRRTATVVPFKPEFNLTPHPSNPSRSLLPGDSSTKSVQCLYALGEGSSPADAIYLEQKMEYDHDDCIELLCSLDNHQTQIKVGPAASGTRCIKGYNSATLSQPMLGICDRNQCVMPT